MKYDEFASAHLDIKSISFDEANAICPFHEDHSPSLRFNLRNGLWLCHGCGEKGNVQTMAMLLDVAAPDDEQVTIDELGAKLQALSEEADDLREGMRLFNEAWLDQFLVDEKRIKKFWKGRRGISKTIIDTFDLGWDGTNDAAIIPLRTPEGLLMGVIRRFTEPDAKWKYLNPKGFKRAESLLFLDRVSGTTVALVEGPIDALKCWSAGVPAVAIYGSSLSSHQADLLRRHGVATVVSFFDNDPAGRLATMRADQTLRGIVHFTVEWPDDLKGSDPGELQPHYIEFLYREAIPFHRLKV